MHRWLLLAYPRDYRRERGAEILETVRAMAPARRGPRLVANLIGHGLRARLGRPASRSVAVWATVFTLACALFGASFATWVAWTGSRPLDHSELAGVVRQLYPGDPAGDIADAEPPAVFVVYGSPLSWDSVDDLLFGDGGEYAPATIAASFDRLPGGDRAQTLTGLRQRLEAAGWDSRGPVYSNSYECIPDAPQCDPATIPSDITVYAMRGDNVLDIHLYGPGTTPVMDLAMARATPWTVYPAGIAGFLVAALSAWFLFGWASRRTEHGGPLTRASANLLYGTGMFLWWAPILFSAPLVLLHHTGEPHFRWHPLWEWLGQPTLSLPFLLGGLSLTAALTLTALPQRRPADRPLAHS
ncbi:hypothetical protein Q0Z83_017310 [Actinoplanes sichuanensis]|uniref:Uncharacterized protein n=1 Tax=Actinoplanes sichuanensis TaxID=512349 RepID=A0ABW4A6Y0_9ACTN|nr:hypothetical protein [Actinoplanes sichuanensis]BEL03540.1 hypothetical protein Q0Z83_017310 [Actinoplanes sichuanensis]